MDYKIRLYSISLYACRNFNIAFFQLSVESLYEVVAAAASLPSSSQSSHPPINASVTTRRHLQYIPLVKLPLIQYCCKLLIATLKVSRASREAIDLMLLISTFFENLKGLTFWMTKNK